MYGVSSGVQVLSVKPVMGCQYQESLTSHKPPVSGHTILVNDSSWLDINFQHYIINKRTLQTLSSHHHLPSGGRLGNSRTKLSTPLSISRSLAMSHNDADIDFALALQLQLEMEKAAQNENQATSSTSKASQDPGYQGAAKIECDICLDDYHAFDIFTIPLCRHHMCRICVAECFELAITHEPSFPAECCRHEIKTSEIKHLIDPTIIERYEEKALEWKPATPEPTAVGSTARNSSIPAPSANKSAAVGAGSEPALSAANPPTMATAASTELSRRRSTWRPEKAGRDVTTATLLLHWRVAVPA